MAAAAPGTGMLATVLINAAPMKIHASARSTIDPKAQATASPRITIITVPTIGATSSVRRRLSSEAERTRLPLTPKGFCRRLMAPAHHQATSGRGVSNCGRRQTSAWPRPDPKLSRPLGRVSG